ncbi:hypothetical protein [Comamonas sp.]|uniref:hypothetical protein n=1 Tax=Comamonas sp. TaxID=34028 RepID=UPI003A90D4EF
MEAQALTARAAALSEALPLLQRAGAKRCDTSAGLLSVEEVARGGACFVVEQGGVPVMAYALGLTTHDAGGVLWVTAAGGNLPGGDLTASILPLIEQQGRAVGARQVAMQTRRRGLVAKLERQGYHVAGYILRKNLDDSEL